MTKEELSQYGILMIEKKMLEKRISNLQISRKQVEYGFVAGSNCKFPLQRKNFGVAGYNIADDEKENNNIKQLKAMLEKKKEECEEELLRIQEYINQLQDSSLRVIFTMTFIEGKTQEQIGRNIHADRSTVAKKIAKYFAA